MCLSYKTGTFCLFALSLLTLFTGCQKKATTEQARIILTADIRGRLVPCGCFTGQLGGMTRLYTELQHLKSATGLRVDAGNAISGQQDFEIIQYEHILKAFNHMEFDALNIGALEAQLSANTLQRLHQESGAPMISANLVDAETNAPILPTHIQTSMGGYSVIIVGVIDDQSITANELGEGLRLQNPELTLRELLPKLRDKADIVVLLAFAKESRLREYADKFYEADFILGGDVRQPSGHTRLINQSHVFYVANHSRTIGLIDFSIKAGEHSKRANIEILKSEPRLLYEQIAEAESIIEIAQAYRSRIRETTLDIDQAGNQSDNLIPGVKMQATYVGSQACASCHEGDYTIWKNTGHSHAWSTLEQVEADADPKCITCHSVGFGETSGYRREFKHEKLVNVGCESCHGPASTHVTEREAGGEISFHFRPLAEADCRTCHYGEFSRPFDWDQFWPHIAHGNRDQNTETKSK